MSKTDSWLAAQELNRLSDVCHAANRKWWEDVNTGERIVRNKGELLMLIVSEISEAMEGERKDLMDDKLPHRKMAEVELADALIRIFDYAGAFGLDIGGAFAEKMEYNAKRADHTHEARRGEHGKKF
jgi:NTP pyrophosphatase (non-canonical NTP hydrolase)